MNILIKNNSFIAKRFLILSFSILTIFALSGCFPISKLPYAFGCYPDSVFEVLPENEKIRFESGGKAFAQEVNGVYKTAKTVIETTHGSEFAAEPKIYLCMTKECYDKYAIIPKAKAETLPLGNSVIMDYQKLSENNSTKAILTHELSHVYWFSRGIRCQPRWWEEGLAVSTSGGGGAEKVSLEEATAAIKSASVFYPSDESSCSLFFGGDSAAKNNISWGMYYRQAGMFVDFLRRIDKEAFDKTLQGLREKRGIYDSVQKGYGKSVLELWKMWKESALAK